VHPPPLRASQGSLGPPALEPPHILYLLQDGFCAASCKFCALSRLNRRAGRLGRVEWPRVSAGDLEKLVGRYKAACIQTIIKPDYWREALEAAAYLREKGLSVRVATQPVSPEELKEARSLVDYLGVGLDAFSPRVLVACGKPYPWRRYIGFIEQAVDVFGEGRVYVHLIAGLGESPEEALRLLDVLYGLGAKVALFPLVGLEKPWPTLVDKTYYRRLQVAAGLLNAGLKPGEYLRVAHGELLPTPAFDDLPRDIVYSSFLTQGCPGCNRPFYTERPGNMYNYPSRRLLLRDMGEVVEELGWGPVGR